MAYHSRNGRDFVGLRRLPNGQHQVVYDAASGERVLVTIRDMTISITEIDAAMQEGILAEKVLPSVLTALTARNIQFDWKD